MNYNKGTDPIVLNFIFPRIPKKDKVKLTLWMSSNDVNSYKLLFNILSAIELHKLDVDLEPKFVVQG